jgi:hypothetical protein
MNVRLTLSADTVVALLRIELECLVRACNDYVGAAVKSVQCTARCILSQKDMCSLSGPVHVCCRTEITCCGNWTESCYMSSELVGEMWWLRIVVGSWGQQLTTAQGFPHARSATDTCKSSMKDARKSRTMGNASVHSSSAWHMMSVFSVRCRRSTRSEAG